MNKALNTAIAGLISIAIPFSTAADDHKNHDFQIPADYFKSLISRPNVMPQNVPIYCVDDFNFQAGPPQPNAPLIRRLDNEGFNGGNSGEIAFLMMNPDERQGFLRAITNPAARSSFEIIARQYDRLQDPQEKRAFIESIFLRYHGWGADRYKQISDECRRRGFTP